MRQIFLISDNGDMIVNDFIESFLYYFKKEQNQNKTLHDFAKHVYRGNMSDAENITRCTPEIVAQLYRTSVQQYGLFERMADMDIVLGVSFWSSIHVL